MRKEWWIAIGTVVAVFVAIGLLVMPNENAYQAKYQHEQSIKTQNDSIMWQMLLDVDSIKEGIRNIEEISESLREGQIEQLKNDTLNRKELQQIGRRIQSTKKK